MSDRNIETMARSLPPSGLLEAAAALVERALRDLGPPPQETCRHCGASHSTNTAHLRAATRLKEIPNKLRHHAAQLKAGAGAGNDNECDNGAYAAQKE